MADFNPLTYACGCALVLLMVAGIAGFVGYVRAANSIARLVDGRR